MALLQQNFKIVKGMNQDVDKQSSTPDSAFRLFNIKNQTLDSANINNLTNEKGNSIIDLKDYNDNDISIDDSIIGTIQCTPDVVVIFTYNKSNSNNIIYKLTYIPQKDTQEDYIKVRKLAEGKFNMSEDSEIAGIFSYENSEVQKVYWVDGINQLRYLNIADINTGTDEQPQYQIITNVEAINSHPSFKAEHRIEVERVSGGGVFESGVIQYAFTYYNKHGAETSIVDMTPLYYISEENRGVREDESVGCSFKVTIYNPDKSFDYIRLYSIQRTSLNGVPIVKIVGDIKLK